MKLKRRWVLWLLIIAGVWVVITRFTEIQKLLGILSLGQWQWVLAAALLQVIYYVVYAAVYQAALHTVEVESRVSELLPVLLSSVFVTVVTPSGGASTAALFMDDAARRGQSPARTAAGFVLVLAADFSAFVLILLIGLIYLFVQNDLQSYQLGATAFLLVLIGALSGVLLMGLWQPLRLRQLLWSAQRVINRTAAWFKRPAWLADDWADRNASEINEAALAMVTYPQRVFRTLTIALFTHLISLATLYALFLAFRLPIQFGPLVAGFAMGQLFLIVSPIPWGIGVVEGVMVLVYTSLGVPTETAAVVTLAYRGLSLWLPLGIGFFLLRRVKAFGAQEYSRAELSSVRAVALLTVLMGLVNLVSGLIPILPSRLALIEQLSWLGFSRGSYLTITLAGFALLLLAQGLWRRKRIAWFLTLIVLDVSIIGHLLKGLDYEEAIAAAALAAWLWYLYPHFHARSDVPSSRQFAHALAAAVGFILAYGTLGFYLLSQQFQAPYTVGGAFLQTLTMFFTFRNPGVEPATGFGQYFVDSIYMVGAATFVYAIFVGLRPLAVRQPATPAQREHAWYIVSTHGCSSLARLSLLPDKSYYFSAGGSLVAFVVKGRVALALGDPIGPPADAAAAVAGYQAHCAVNNWQPAFYQVSPAHLEHYRAAGFETLGVGEEASIDLQAFDMESMVDPAIQSNITGLSKLGYRTQVYAPLLPDGVLHELRAVSDEWLAARRTTEKHFAMGWFDDDYLRTTRVIAVHNPEGLIVAFANILPEYCCREIVVDLVRQRHEAPAGIAEFLFVNLIQWAAGQGYACVNLGLAVAPGADEPERADDWFSGRSVHYMVQHLKQLYTATGERAFKEQFGPGWSARYLVYPGRVSLPSVVLALIRANSDDGFLWSYLKDMASPTR